MSDRLHTGQVLDARAADKIYTTRELARSLTLYLDRYVSAPQVQYHLDKIRSTGAVVLADNKPMRWRRVAR